MLFPKKRGFTLLELLVVISIIGILAATLITPMTRMAETARATKCKANLRNLAQAIQSYVVRNDGNFPDAQSSEYPVLTRSGKAYSERNGWVSWTGSGRWSATSSQKGKMTPSCFYGENARDSITNGLLWSGNYLDRDFSVFLCDVHKKAAREAKLSDVCRSYVMNGYFSWKTMSSVSKEVTDASKLLLLAELPAQTIETSQNAADSALETMSNGSHAEIIGFNHLVGKRYVAHVAFADGHVDGLLEPTGSSDNDLKELTLQLCNGADIDEDILKKMR